ncbi:two-component system response regulator CreB [Motilimonas eburnea]|uniref:two-component system response regulator CreB n=1 Tax=Motilimonas eburnea TaxID=1737488 RepID=UPI001E398C65|nr:two-component system response regulator CreB [Motilimonas eburnea]MCE2571956.1 two-component system response regulator CreB [Motilimonas eburnea]
MKVLVVEDEQAIADNIVYSLKLEGFAVQHCMLGNDALSLLKQQPFDLMILDVGLPDINGFEVCKLVRQFSELPIIFLTARDHEIDRVVGLEIGGDDYVTKPFSPRELVARVKVILKRVRPTQPASGEVNQAAILLCDDVKKQWLYYGQPLDLTRYEYGLLATLFSQPERVFSRDQLMAEVWPDACGSFDRAVDTHIKGLRAKLKKVAEHDLIKTHRGLGYSLVLPCS